MPPEKSLHIIETGGRIVGREKEHGLKQQLRIIQNLQLRADFGEQAHGLDMIAVAEEVLPYDPLRLVNLSVTEHARGGDNLGGQARKGFHVACRHVGICGFPGHSKQDLQRVPACGQRGIEIHSAQERLDSRLRGAQRHVAVSAFLEEAAVGGMQCFETSQGRECLRDALQETLADSHQVQNVTVLGNLREQRFGGRERCGELSALQKSPDASDFGFDG